MSVRIGTRDWSFTPVYDGQRKPAVVHERQGVVTIDGHLSDVQQLEAAAEASLAIRGRAVTVAADAGAASRPADRRQS